MNIDEFKLKYPQAIYTDPTNGLTFLRSVFDINLLIKEVYGWIDGSWLVSVEYGLFIYRAHINKILRSKSSYQLKHIIESVEQLNKEAEKHRKELIDSIPRSGLSIEPHEHEVRWNH